MKANKATEQALIAMLNRMYEEIRAIEEAWDIRGDATDYRARIEYFHDAIRARSNGDTSSRRLSVEFLSYDISMLRHIQSNPLARAKGAKPTGSPSTALVAAGQGAGTAAGKMDATTRQKLAEGYKGYAVLFAALLSETADRDYQSRVDEANMQVENIARLEQAVKAMPRQQVVNIEYLLDSEIDDPDLEAKLKRQMQAEKRKKLLASDALREFKEMIAATDKQIKTVEQAHFTFVTSQLAVYESARDVVKKMASQGMNIVGAFVENAVNQAQRGGRGF